MDHSRRTPAERLILCVAEGFGSGRAPIAPGTFGTLVGFFWVYFLLLPGSLLLYCVGLLLGFFAAVWLGGRGEQILARKDPGSIVIDEIAALPLAFSGALFVHGKSAALLPLAGYFHGKGLLVMLVAFLGFRFFDVAKPGIIGRSQNLPGGWGLVVDDFLAALHVIPFTYLAGRLFL